jgi:hypothetical protein
MGRSSCWLWTRPVVRLRETIAVGAEVSGAAHPGNGAFWPWNYVNGRILLVFELQIDISGRRTKAWSRWSHLIWEKLGHVMWRCQKDASS